MKRNVLSGIAFAAALCASTAFAQTPASSQTPPSPAVQSTTPAITMSGCVAKSTTGAEGFLLSNPIVLPSTGAATAPSSSATAAGATASAGATQPPASATGTAGTSGTAGTAATAGTAGTSGTAATGSASVTPPAMPSAGASSSAFNGYKLTGNDMAQWAGKRVEITGTFVPSTTANTTASASGASSTTLQEFRVVSVKPVGGSCPQE